jgi:excisionase family DNA binding protein
VGDVEQLLDIKEAARLLGVSETSLRRWTNSGVLACVRVGGRRERRFRQADLLAFLEHQPADGAPGGRPIPPGSHLCALFASDSARVSQAADFLADGLGARSLCLLVAASSARNSILRELKRRVPSLKSALADRRLLPSLYGATGRAQIDYFRREFARAARAGFRSIRILGDLSDGGPSRTNSFAEVLEFEADLDRFVSDEHPAITLCQYDARRLSGLEVRGVLRCHHHALRYPTELLPD